MRWLDWLVRWFVPSAPGPRRPPVHGPIPDPAAVVAALNRVRARAFLSPLAEDHVLDGVAQRRASVMASSGQLTHAGYAVAIREAVPGSEDEGECVAMGDLTAEGLIALWVGDAAHRAIVLGPYNRVGCGVAQAVDGTPYWVADFVQLPGVP